MRTGWEAQNRATDGDVVAIMMLPREQWLAPASKLGQDEEPEIGQEATEKTDRPCAKVVGIIRRSWRPYCGTLDTRGRGPGELRDGVSTKLMFVPAERTVPRVRITTRQAASLSGKRIVVAIDTWERTQRSPTGHYVKVIGTAGACNRTVSLPLPLSLAIVVVRLWALPPK